LCLAGRGRFRPPGSSLARMGVAARPAPDGVRRCGAR
jgi:hypothetical protein